MTTQPGRGGERAASAPTMEDNAAAGAAMEQHSLNRPRAGLCSLDATSLTVERRQAHQPRVWPLLLWRYVDDVAMLTTVPRRAARVWAAHAPEDLHWYAYIGHLWPRYRTGIRRPVNCTPSAAESTTAGSGASEDADSDQDPDCDADQEPVRAQTTLDTRQCPGPGTAC